MRSVDVVVVGGGPAGAAAAERLKVAGADVLVLDKERFPRHKLCAGWITPQVLTDLQLEAGAYPHGFLSFRRLHFHVRGPRLAVPCVQHSIRRFEFDAWLLERSGAEFVQHTVREIRANGDGYYEIDGIFRCRHLIGAGGTSCPVRRSLFGATHPRTRTLQTATLELEFPCDWRDGDCHLWFFEHGLPGYSWYVPKAAGWLNVGIGGMATRLKQRGENIREHWLHLAEKLQSQFGIEMGDPTGYSYYVRDFGAPVRIGNAYLTGDSAGLATRDLCEGIGPAISSGQQAAHAIITGSEYTLEGVTDASLGGGLISRCVDWAFTRGAGRAIQH